MKRFESHPALSLFKKTRNMALTTQGSNPAILRSEEGMVTQKSGANSILRRNTGSSTMNTKTSFNFKSNKKLKVKISKVFQYSHEEYSQKL